MSGNTFGKNFSVTSWGESHGPAVGIVIDGCPSLINIDINAIQSELDRRAPGQSDLTTPRKEKDQVKILSGIYQGKTTGTPLTLIIENQNQKSSDYHHLNEIYRPGHADFVYDKKYGIRDPRGGGRSSARMTAGLVAAGAVAKVILKDKLEISILAYVNQVHQIKAQINPLQVTLQQIEATPVRCPDSQSAQKMIDYIKEVKNNGDSVGGIIECVVKNVPIGLGEPVFDKLSANLAKAMFSINAVKGFEIGNGFTAATLLGSENNDPFINDRNQIKAQSNRAGGILGGISNGMPIVFRTAFKPTPTIGKNQQTVNRQGKKVELEAKGRHDPCVLPRAVPVVEAMAAITICDAFLSQFKE
ncbi:MAG: chorismate synthase [Spirochaetes bacterium]|nr:chorismate synthase [Spirochaetota bacterium]